MKNIYQNSAIFCVAILCLTFALACDTKNEDIVEASAEEKKLSIRVKTMTVEGAIFSQQVTLIGSSKPDREVSIASEVGGRVTKIAFDKGDEVEAGKPLLYLDDSKIQADLAQAGASRDIAKLDYEKYRALKKRNAAVSPFDLELASLKLKAAEASYKSLLVLKDKYTIKAPISGKIVNRDTEKGAIVTPGMPLARIISIRPIKVSFGIPEATIGDFSIGKKGTVYFDAYPDREFTGIISFLSPEVNRRAGTFICELKLPNEEGLIFPEMSAKVTMVRKEMAGSILIPQTAILELSDGHAVFVVDDEGIARQKRITVDDYSNEMALIATGVSASDKLVIVGQRGLLDGDVVAIVE